VRSEERADTRLFRELSRTLLKEGISVRFRAMGRSMFPAIRDGETIQVDPARKSHDGDVMLVDSSDGIRVHRVVATDSATVVTRGDSCLEPDAATARSSIMGHASKVFSAEGERAPHTLRTRLRQWSRRIFPSR
jgi:hypothetical protein